MKLNLSYRYSLILTIIILVSCSSAVLGQLTGTKNIPGDYATITAAVTSLNAAGVGTGGVSFNVAANYTETITATISITATGTVANPILFQKDPATTGANPLITAYTTGSGTPATAIQDGIWRLVGSDYVTIDGIDVSDNPANTSNPSTMEYGYALYKASTSNGCQFVTIQHCVITLNNINNALGTAPMVDGSSGIIVMNALFSTAVTPVNPAAGGTNSNNKFYTNTIQNCNTGIALIGYAAASPFTLADTNNDVGGSAASTGNTIINFGGAAAAANPAAAIRTLAQYGLNVSYNIINNNNGSGTNHPNTLRGIYIKTATSATAAITHNTITVKGGGTTQAVSAIENVAGSTAAVNTINISNNTITNCTYATATTGTLYGIYNLAGPASLSIYGNTISNNAFSGTTGIFYGIYNSGIASIVTISSNILSGNSTSALTTGIFYGIRNSAVTPRLTINSNSFFGNFTSSATEVHYPVYNSGAVTTSINIDSNNIGTGIGGAMTFNAANSGSQIFIYNAGGAAGSALSISNNNFHGVTYAAGGSGTNTYISNTAATLSQAINSNTFTNLNVNTTGNIVFITNSVIVPATGTQNVNNNTIAGTFTKTGVGGSVTLFSSAVASLANSVINNNNNNFSNITVTGSTTIAGWVNTDAGASTKTIQNNTFSNWTGGTGAITAMSVSLTGINNATTGNAINNITSAGSITGITTGAGNDKIYSNIINTLVSSGTVATTVTGIAVTSGTAKNVYQNTIYNLQGNSMTTGSVKGIIISGGTTVNAYQNTIYTLQANAITTGTVSGIWLSGGTTIAAYNNKIYDLSSSSSAITGFVNGIQVSGSSVSTITVRNNLIGDLRTPAASSADPIRGIGVISTGLTSAVNVYNNTIYLNAISTGANFGSTGIYHTINATATTAALDLRNNIVINTSVPTGTGLTVAYRRSGTTLTNYATASNNNLFYAGLASANRLIFYDGTNLDQFLSTYKPRVSSRDAQSVTEDMITASKFLSTIGSSASFLHLDSTKATQAESGGISIGSVTIDFDGQIRQGQTGYTGTGTAPDIGADEVGGIRISTLSGTYNVGAGQTFTSLTNADGLFANINSRGLSGNVVIYITSDLTEDGSNALYQWVEQGLGNYTLTIQPDASTARMISGNVLTGMIRLNGAKRVTIDGSNGTASKYLTFRNSNTTGTTGTAFTFINGATNNTIKYCNIEAYANVTNGVVLFSTSTVAGGNSNNLISYCNINATVGSNTGNVCIYSAGTVGKENSTNTISNNNVFNYRDRALDITATGSAGWTVSGNSFYNGDVTASINYASASTLHGIRILGGTGYLILNNYVGGNAASAGGTAASYTSTLGNVSFQGILLTTSGASPASNIKGNTIANIAISSVPTAAGAAFAGIETNGSGITIGGASPGDGNLIGSNAVNGSISVTTTTGTSTFTTTIRAINCNSTGGAVVSNQAGGFDIKNIGAAPAASSFIGIYVSNPTAPSQVNNNIIGIAGVTNSIRVLSASTATATSLTGILIGTTVISTVLVDGNIVQNLSNLNSVNTTGPIIGIGSGAATATANVTISNNTISSLLAMAFSVGTGTPTSSYFIGINNTGAGGTVRIKSNTIKGFSTNSTAGNFNAIRNTGAVITSVQIDNNQIGNSTTPAITFNVANSGTQIFINNTGGGANSALSISNNNFQGVTYSAAGSSANTYILNSAATLSQAINGNTFTNLNINTTGSIIFISNSVIVAGTGTQNVNSNSIAGTFTKTGAGTVTLFTSIASSLSGSIINNNSNNFSNITVTGTAIIAGWVNTDAGASTKTIQNNTFSNWTGATGAITALNVNLTGTNNNITDNAINNISSAAAITGITTGAGNDKIYSNIINTLSTTGASAVTGIAVTGGTAKNIYKNKIYDLQANNATGTVNGILVSGTTIVIINIYNNLIGDLRTPIENSATDAIRGISVTATAVNSTINAYYNTVYLNANSTGASFSSSGIYHTINATATTALLNLRNNSITNTSTPKGTGVTAAYRRSAATLTNYASTSNNNLFYAGTPSATRVIFYDGTSSDQTLTFYKLRVLPRDISSVTENLTAKFLSTSGSSSVFLHMNSAIANTLESGAVNITGFTDDFDGQIRAGNPGYTGTSSSPDIGADEIFGIETLAPVITYTLFGNTTSTANRNITGISITDGSGINTFAGTNPRIYYKRNSDANAWLDNSSSTNGWKYTQATNSSSPFIFTIDYSLLYGGASVTAGVIQYFIVAQDIATTANIAINSGTFASAPSGVALISANFPIGGTINSYTIPFSGSYNVGTGEVFTSFTKTDGLFASVNSAGLMGNTTFNITSDITEDGTNALNQWTESGAGNYTLSILPDAATLRTISGNAGGGLIRLDGADRVTIDGSNSGTESYLSFINTNTSGTTGTAFTFINGATNNIIRYAAAQAYSNSSNGVIIFSTSAIVDGNSNNLIDNCTINATVASQTGNVAIYSAGTIGNENSTNTISNNSIFNYRDRALDITSTGSTGWSITGNNFYNGNVTNSINYSASSELHGIRISGGSGYSILNNYIGGNTSQASGINALYSSTSGNVSYHGILLSTTNAIPPSDIKGNTIAGITISSVPTFASSYVFTGIETNGSGINIGGSSSSDGNIIGSNVNNGSIIINTSTTSTANTSGIIGINCISSDGIINNNQVGGFDISNTGTAPASSTIQGIYVNNAVAPTQVNNNLIGSTSISNSIRVLPASTSSTTSLKGIEIGTGVNSAVQVNDNRIENISNLSTVSSGSFTGINNTSSLSSAVITINNDTIQNINTVANSNSGSTIYSGIFSSSASIISNNIISDITLASTGANAQVIGINVSGAFADTISGNIISSLSTASTKAIANVETDTPAESAIIGILNSTTSAGQIINNNRLAGLRATSSAAVNVIVTGFGITSTGSGSIFNNRFGTMTNLATGSAPAICHIVAANGSFNVYNNTLRISNLLNMNSMKVYGIVHASATNWNYYHNTVRVGGSTNGTALRSAAFLLSVNSTPILKNNIFFNIRTGTGYNYAISNLGSPPSNWPANTSDYNDFYSINSNTVAEWGNNTGKTFSQWQSLTGGDAHSISNAISFITSTYDLEPDSVTNCNVNDAGTPITGPLINADINNNPRSTVTPDLGAYEFNYTGFTIIAGNNSPICSGDSVSLSVDPGKAISPAFSWTDSANIIISTLQNPTLILTAGLYKVTVTDSTGCYMTDSTIVLINQRPTATLTSQASLCDSGLVNLNISVTGTGVFNGTLSNGDIFSGTAPLIIVPVNVTTTTSYSISDLSDASCIAIPADIHDTVTVTVTHKGDWLGITSTWSDPVNWCEGIVPTSSTNVTIPGGTSIMPIITGSANCNSITIETGDTLTIAGTGTLNIAGTLTNFGTYVDNGSTNFNGTSGLQTFSGVTAFNNLTLNNTSGLLLPVSITVNTNLTISAGTLNANNSNIAIKGTWTNNVSTTAFTPGTGTVTFNGTTAQSIGGTFATGFNNLTITSTAATVTLNVNTSIGDNLSVSSGTFDLAGFTANRASAGGTLLVANNATLKIGGTNTYPTNYTTNILVVASTIEYSGTNQTISNQLYGNLKLSSSAGAAVKTFPATALTVVGNFSSVVGAGTSVSFTAASNITFNGNVSIGASTTFNGGSYSHNIGGNWVNNGLFNGNTGTVIFTGTGTSVGGPGTQNFNNLTIAASGISFATGNISLTGNLSTTGAGSFTQASGGTLLMTGTGTTISGTGISLNNLTVSGSVSTTISLTLSGNLSVSGSFTASIGTITMSGTSKTMSGTGTMGFAVLSVSGSITTDANFSISSGLTVPGSFSASAATVTFTGTSSLSGTANLYNVTINGTTLQLGSNSVLGIANIFTITSGTLDVTTSGPNTVNFNGTGAQNINAVIYSNLVLSNGNTKTVAGAITTLNDITIGTGTIFNPSSYIHSVYGNWINNGTFIAGTSTVQFLGPANANLSGATTFNILTSNTSSSTTELILQSNISAAIVNMTNGVLLTGSDTLTITGTRTGNGFIRGHIKRMHAFTTGIPYAFEGPDNTITFTSVSSVTSITVSVAEGDISDFPFGASINREYNIAVPTGTYNATLRLHYEDDELNANDESTMALWNYNGTLWGSEGKTANSSTANYVELSGLTDLTNRWTCSDDANVLVWNGSISTDWQNAANWTTVQGSPSSIPSASDIVNLGTAAFTFQPTISNAAITNNILFGSIQAVTLTIAGGGSLNSKGNISGSWTADATHTINVNNQTLTVNGNMDLSDGINGRAIDLNIGSGTVTILGSLFQNGEANINFAGTGTLNIYNDFEHESGIFTAGNGTVIYNGNENQHIAHVNYNMLTINKAGGIATIDSVVNIAGNLLISSGVLDNFSTTTVAGNVTIDPAGIFYDYFHELHVKGNWNNNGAYFATGSSIFFDGSATQNISASTFNNLIINKPIGANAILTGNVSLNGDLTVLSGTLDIKTFACDRSVPGGAATVAAAGTIIIGGNYVPVNFTSGSIDNASTIIFDGTGPQALFLPSLGHLILRNSGVKTLVSPVTVNGNFTIENGAIFNGSSNTLTLLGNWVNNGTFSPSTSTVLCAGTAKTISGNTTFNRFTITGSYTLLNNITFNNLLDITSTGSLSGGPTIQTILHGDLINSGVLYSLGTTTFTGNVLQTLSLINAVTTVALTVNFNGTVSPVLNSTSAPQFGYLNINNTGGINPSVGWTIAYSLSVGAAASFNGGNATHNILGALNNNGTITSNGTLNFVPSTSVPVNLGNNFSSTGIVNFGGAGAMTLAGSPSSLYNVVISNMNVAGISPSSNWNITNNFTVNSGSKLNAGNYSYLVGGNILNSGTINSGTSGFTLNGTGIQNIYTVSPFNNLTINKTTGLTILSSNATVNGVLNFVKGNIQTGSNLIIQQSSGTLTGAAQNTGWVDGNLQKNIAIGTSIVRVFEVGDNINYTPVSLLLANVTASGDLTTKTTASDHPYLATSEIDHNKTVNRYFTIINAGTAFTTASVTFNWVAADVDPGATTSNFKVKNYNGSIWALLTTASPLATFIQATGVSAFGDFAIGELTVATWTGNVNTDWFTSGNWSSGVPLQSTNTLIPGSLTNYPLLNTGTGAVQNISIQSGASLTVSGATLQITGFLSNAGVFTASNGTVEMKGSSAQTIPAATFAGNTIKNLTINNSAGVTLGGILNLSSILNVTAGQLNTGGYLTLLSTATQTALIDGGGAGSVVGNVTMQRYLAVGFGYKYFSSPFQAATVDEFSNDLDLGASFPSFYRYDENLVSSGWVNYTSTSGILNPGEGYAANFGSSSSPKTVDITGSVNNNTISTATLYNHNRPFTQGFNLVGNPYPSPIDWDASNGWVRTNIDNAVYYFNASDTGQYTGTYSSYINGISSDGFAGNIIPSMQGFFVHVTNGSFPVSAQLTFNNSIRVNDPSPVFQSFTGPMIRLSAGFTDDEITSDAAVFYFDDRALKTFDKKYDALKLMNTNEAVPNLYAVSQDAAKISIRALAYPRDSVTVQPLGLKTEKEGWITFNARDIQNISQSVHIYLLDAKTNSYQDLRREPRYSLYLASGDYANRFSIVFSLKELGPNTGVNDETFNAYSTNGKLFVNCTLPAGEKANLVVFNMLGRIVHRQELSGNGIHQISTVFINGVYIVSLYSNKEKHSKKVFIGR